MRAVLLSRHSQAHGCSNRPRAEACARPCNTPTASRKHAKRNSNNNVLRCFDMNACAGGQAGRPARRRPRSLSARATRAGTPRRAARSCACKLRTRVSAFAGVRARVCRWCACAQRCGARVLAEVERREARARELVRRAAPPQYPVAPATGAAGAATVRAATGAFYMQQPVRTCAATGAFYIGQRCNNRCSRRRAARPGRSPPPRAPV